ncbi:MAG: MFS transporter [Sulfolobaceae archaeon]|nr:MFS transporter [Sulfolobaceae archaeon]
MASSNLRWTIVGLMFTIITIDYIDRGIVPAAEPILTKLFSLNPIEIALIGNGFLYGYLIMNPIVGYLLDRYGPRKVLSSFVMGWGVVELITALATSALYLIFARVLLGVVEAAGFPAVTKVTANWLTRSEKARGGTIGDAGVNVGVVLGSLVLVWFTLFLPTTIAWRIALVAVGIVSILLGVILRFVVHDSPEKHPGISREELEYIRNNQEVSVEQKKVPVIYWFKTKDYWAYMMGLGAQAGIFFGLFTWLPEYLYYARHLSLSLTLYSLALIWGFGFVGEITGGFIIDSLIKRKGANFALKLGFAVSSLSVTIGLLLVATLTTSTAEAIAMLSVTFFFLRWSGIQWGAPSFIVPQEYAGQWGGHIGLWETLWGIVLPIFFGYLLALTHSYDIGIEMFGIVGIIYFLGASVLTTYKRLKIYVN